MVTQEVREKVGGKCGTLACLTLSMFFTQMQEGNVFVLLNTIVDGMVFFTKSLQNLVRRKDTRFCFEFFDLSGGWWNFSMEHFQVKEGTPIEASLQINKLINNGSNVLAYE